jgi:uncharacterized membrane protein
MTSKQFLFVRLLVVVLIAATVSSFIVAGNYIVPIMAAVTGAILLYSMKKKVKGVMEDERDYEVAGKAARYSITIFTAIASLVIIVLFSQREGNPQFELVGAVLAYSICALMILYSLIFKYYQKIIIMKNKTWMIALFALMILLFTVFGLRLFSGEDDWMCQDGQWIKHGQPSVPMPTKKCDK